MEIQKETDLLECDIQKIISLLEETIIDKIKNIEKEEEELKSANIEEIKKNTSTEVRCYFDLVLEKILNYFLDKIKDLNVKDYFELTKRAYINDEIQKVPEQFRIAEQLIDKIMEYCDPCGKYEEVYEDAEYVAYSLMRKKVNINGLELPEPLKLEYVKFYAFSSNTLPKEMDNEIWYIILYIATHYYVLKKLSSK